MLGRHSCTPDQAVENLNTPATKAHEIAHQLGTFLVMKNRTSCTNPLPKKLVSLGITAGALRERKEMMMSFRGNRPCCANQRSSTTTCSRRDHCNSGGDVVGCGILDACPLRAPHTTRAKMAWLPVRAATRPCQEAMTLARCMVLPCLITAQEEAFRTSHTIGVARSGPPSRAAAHSQSRNKCIDRGPRCGATTPQRHPH